MPPTVTGLPEIKANFRKYESRQGKALARGLVRAGLFLQRVSQKIVPVEFAFLRQIAQTRKSGEGINTDVTVSYGTDYAVFVHEIEENEHAPGKQAKFLEEPARTERKKMLTIIWDEMRKRLK